VHTFAQSAEESKGFTFAIHEKLSALSFDWERLSSLLLLIKHNKIYDCAKSIEDFLTTNKKIYSIIGACLGKPWCEYKENQ
jgi:hypothetical protein